MQQEIIKRGLVLEMRFLFMMKLQGCIENLPLLRRSLREEMVGFDQL